MDTSSSEQELHNDIENKTTTPTISPRSTTISTSNEPMVENTIINTDSTKSTDSITYQSPNISSSTPSTPNISHIFEDSNVTTNSDMRETHNLAYNNPHASNDENDDMSHYNESMMSSIEINPYLGEDYRELRIRFRRGGKDTQDIASHMASYTKEGFDSLGLFEYACRYMAISDETENMPIRIPLGGIVSKYTPSNNRDMSIYNPPDNRVSPQSALKDIIGSINQDGRSIQQPYTLSDINKIMSKLRIVNGQQGKNTSTMHYHIKFSDKDNLLDKGDAGFNPLIKLYGYKLSIKPTNSGYAEMCMMLEEDCNDLITSTISVLEKTNLPGKIRTPWYSNEATGQCSFVGRLFPSRVSNDGKKTIEGVSIKIKYLNGDETPIDMDDERFTRFSGRVMILGHLSTLTISNGWKKLVFVVKAITMYEDKTLYGEKVNTNIISKTNTDADPNRTILIARIDDCVKSGLLSYQEIRSIIESRATDKTLKSSNANQSSYPPMQQSINPQVVSTINSVEYKQQTYTPVSNDQIYPRKNVNDQKTISQSESMVNQYQQQQQPIQRNMIYQRQPQTQSQPQTQIHQQTPYYPQTQTLQYPQAQTQTSYYPQTQAQTKIQVQPQTQYRSNTNTQSYYPPQSINTKPSNIGMNTKPIAPPYMSYQQPPQQTFGTQGMSNTGGSWNADR